MIFGLMDLVSNTSDLFKFFDILLNTECLLVLDFIENVVLASMLEILLVRPETLVAAVT